MMHTDGEQQTLKRSTPSLNDLGLSRTLYGAERAALWAFILASSRSETIEASAIARVSASKASSTSMSESVKPCLPCSTGHRCEARWFSRLLLESPCTAVTSVGPLGPQRPEWERAALRAIAAKDERERETLCKTLCKTHIADREHLVVVGPERWGSHHQPMGTHEVDLRHITLLHKLSREELPRITLV